MKKIYSSLGVLLILFFVSACGPSEADLAETEAVILSTEHAQSTNTMSVEQTSSASTQHVFDTQTAGTSQASTATEAFQATETSVQATGEASALSTQIAKTEQAIARATHEAAGIYSVVQALYDAGDIPRAEGNFQPLPNYYNSWAQIGWLQNHMIEDSFVRDFVLVVNVSWESASRSAEFYRSGCGIAFRVADDFSEYYSFSLALDGKMKFIPKVRDAKSVYASSAYWGKIDHMEGSATIIITAVGTTYQVFNEQLERIDIRYGEEIRSGNLAYQLISGTNTDFGTRCMFTDTGLWRLDE